MRIPALLLAVALVGATPVFPAEDADAPEYDILALYVPAGDADAGRKAFVELSCTSCHQVFDEAELPAPISAHPGPMLGGAPRAYPGVVASAIVSPSHRIEEEAAKALEGTLSPMGDYSHVMTVRQLVDVVAYLSQQSELAAKESPAGMEVELVATLEDAAPTREETLRQLRLAIAHLESKAQRTEGAEQRRAEAAVQELRSMEKDLEGRGETQTSGLAKILDRIRELWEG